MNYTPLRYPGGKSKLGPLLGAILKRNRLLDATYAEPYAGGAGAALFLLFRGWASRIHLNDIDPAVVSFWRAILTHPEKFAKLIETVPLTVAEWERQRDVYRSAEVGFGLGFAFFYLNRTNRSGIMNGGVIGGKEQTGEWKIDARFPRETLATRVRAIAGLRRAVTVERTDALEFLSTIARQKARKQFVYLDPPYYHKGSALYLNSYTPADHQRIARRLGRLSTPWVLTYDDCAETRALYATHRIHRSDVSYSALENKRGSEIMVLHPDLRLPSPLRRPTTDGFRLI